MSSPLDLPSLPTLQNKPSWLNFAGNLDRSACVELRIGEYRKARGWRGYREVYDEEAEVWETRYVVEPFLDERPAVNGRGRISSGYVTIRESDLVHALRHRVARPLAGDWRTTRANTMRMVGF